VRDLWAIVALLKSKSPVNRLAASSPWEPMAMARYYYKDIRSLRASRGTRQPTAPAKG
jgi:hypothetical protein